MIPRDSETYNTNINKNFKVKEFFVSGEFPELAKRGFYECDDQVFNSALFLAVIEQVIRDFLNTGTPYEARIYNTSGYRNKELNKEVGGEDESFHLKGMAVDFHCGGNNHYLPIIYDYLQAGIDEYLKPSQIILYQHKVGHPKQGHPIFIHITIPQPGVKQRAWIEEI